MEKSRNSPINKSGEQWRRVGENGGEWWKVREEHEKHKEREEKFNNQPTRITVGSGV